ncbi:MAG: ketoacyl-ACP synthase III [Sulfolobales archaeon]|nr:ketoacyl-ACP synthase III [Sulfolobales archaeon]MDW8083453.1 ketoacyl-ACP synthase III [Sulfolobales archaeon]
MPERFATIISTGIYVPSTIMSPEDFEKKTGVRVDPLFIERTGIKVKRVASPNETPATMATNAAKMALERAGLTIKDIDMIIVGTDTPEAISPPTAPKIQSLLEGGPYEIPAFDVNASCANPVYMLELASSIIAGNPKYRNIMVIGVYAMTRFLRWKYMWEWIFSDGAGAVILSASDRPGYLGGRLRADGSFWDYWGIFFGAWKPIAEQVGDENLPYLDLRKTYPPVNDQYWPILIRDVVNQAGIGLNDISQIIFTQVRLKTILDVMKNLNLPESKTHWIMDKYGYTGSACIYMALHDAVEMGKVEKGKVVIFVASGVGYQQGAVAFRWIN